MSGLDSIELLLRLMGAFGKQQAPQLPRIEFGPASPRFTFEWAGDDYHARIHEARKSGQRQSFPKPLEELSLGQWTLRDRFSRYGVKSEFESDPEKGSTAIAPERNLYATYVSDNRYAVIWHRPQDSNVIRVLAVVPKQNWGEDAILMREKLKRVVEAESYGHCTI